MEARMSSSMEKKAPRESCLLHEANGLEAWCTREKCIYWRLLDAQDIEVSNSEACGLQHFGIIGKIDSKTAKWLLNMKNRLENTTPEAGKARINFRRREKQ